MSNLDDFRLRIQDKVVGHVQTWQGDGSQTIFFLQNLPVTSNSQTITVSGAAYTKASSSPGATEYTLNDATGKVTFGAAPANGAFVQADYTTSAFSDTELTAVLLNHSITAANSNALPNSSFYPSWLDVIEMLLMDAQRRFKWSTIGGQDVDQTKVFSNLLTLRAQMHEWNSGDVFVNSGPVSWPEQQENY